jgi:hypothetical protein
VAPRRCAACPLTTPTDDLPSLTELLLAPGQPPPQPPPSPPQPAAAAPPARCPPTLATPPFLTRRPARPRRQSLPTSHPTPADRRRYRAASPSPPADHDHHLSMRHPDPSLL